MISETILCLGKPISIYVTKSGGKMFQEYFGIHFVYNNNNNNNNRYNNNNNNNNRNNNNNNNNNQNRLKYHYLKSCPPLAEKIHTHLTELRA